MRVEKRKLLEEGENYGLVFTKYFKEDEMGGKFFIHGRDEKLK